MTQSKTRRARRHPARHLALGASLLSGLALACSSVPIAPEPSTTAPAAATQPQTPTKACTHMNKIKRVPVPLIEHRLTPEQIRERATAAESRCTKALDQIVALTPEARTFDNTIDAFEQSLMDYVDAVNRLAILKDIHPDEPIRLAAAEVEEASGKYLVQLMARRDLYGALKAYADTKAPQAALDAEQKRLVDLTLRDFRRNGHDLDEATQKKLVEL